MTNKELIHHIIKLYQQANQLTAGFHNAAVTRGRRHIISSMVEDLLANFMQQRLADPDLRFWVDYALSYKLPGGGRAKTIYPDIAVVRQVRGHNQVVAIVDVKMDLGWKRDFGTRMPAIAQDIQELKQASNVNRRVPNEGGRKFNEAVSILPQLKLKYAIMGDQNGSAAEFEANRVAAAQHPDDLQFYAFTTGHYLGYATVDNIVLRDDEIDLFIDDLRADVAASLSSL